MKDCETCGNEIPDIATTCRFCGTHQHTKAPAGSREKIRSVNVEAGLPSITEGLVRLEGDIMRAKQAGIRVVRVIHGWGSTGTGGKLRDACRAFLQRQLAAKRIRSIVHGDDYSRSAVSARELMSRWPDLKASERSDTNNPGITFVEL